MDNYTLQDRGARNRYAEYLANMDAVIVEKVASASAYFSNKSGNLIVDVGMASGTSTNILAMLFHNCRVMGVDINPKMVDFAKDKYKLPNLEFRVDDGEKLETLSSEKVHGFFNCSSIHHITSFNNYNPHKAYLTLQRQAELLSEGGVIVVRDFAKPEDINVIISLSEYPTDNKDVINCSDADLLLNFSRNARSLSLENEKGFPVEELTPHQNFRRFKLSFADALEFIRRKDYRTDWDVELQEEYAYFSQNDFEEIFSNLGMRIIVSYPIFNSWIIKNRYTGKFQLTDLEGNNIGIPPTNYIIAAEKVINKGTKLKAIRHLPILEKKFLEIKNYQKVSDNQVFEIARRPNPVLDLIPYFITKDEELKILAKSSYPRPVINQIPLLQIIDNKHYSGYITESITVSKNDETLSDFIPQSLFERVNIEKEAIKSIKPSLQYYTSPGGIDEKVDSIFVELDNKIVIKEIPPKSFSGFEEGGIIKAFDALELIKSAQAGALPEARIELNIYNLLNILKINPGKWLCEKILVNESNLVPTSLNELLQYTDNERYEAFPGSAGFIEHSRVKFYEYGRETSSNILEYIQPKMLSINTIVTLPIFRYNNKIYVGIEKRNLPVPQLQEGKSFILTAPASRLPKNINNLLKMHEYLLNLEIYKSKVLSFTKLGEKYLPCCGVTPEQVYPFVVNLETPTPDLYWVELNELIRNVKMLRDGHLLICLFRLHHSLA